MPNFVEEPFRIFFPAAVLVGILGVALWPLHFAGIRELYPGQSHARLMTHGFFGGFIFGFLGTALPRMLSARPLTRLEVTVLFCLYTFMSAAHVLGATTLGDWGLLLAAIAFLGIIITRFFQRKDVPPPGFILVALAFACLISGTILGLTADETEPALFANALQRLLSYQGFVLLPILGVGGFILPRFFGLPSLHDFPEGKTPPPGWGAKAIEAAAIGLLIVISFFVEASGWQRAGHLLRLIVSAAYLARTIPLHRSATPRNSLATTLLSAFVLLVSGFVAIALFPGYRVGFLHLTLIGGFGIITFVVATRVVFGHSGNQSKFKQRNRWLTISVILMLAGMATRISGDFWPKIMVSHYNYGALILALGALLWSAYVLPKVLVPDPE